MTAVEKQKRVLLTRKGGPEVLEIVEREVPEPGPGEARVRVLATGVAFCSTVAIASALDRGQSSVDLDARDRQRIRGCRHRNAAAAGEIAYRRVNVRCVTPLGDETASMS